MKVKTNKQKTSYDFNLIRNMITSELYSENNQFKVALSNDVTVTKKENENDCNVFSLLAQIK